MNRKNEEELTQAIIEIVKEATRSNNVSKDSSTDTLSEWDSLAYMSILSEIEVEYSLEITEDNIEKFNSISSIVGIIQKNNM
tara:strand:- start:1311 stop:1556 length:246 start_codon:yes stop_codon:yes gene_type:complete